MVRRTVLLEVPMTVTVSAPGLTTHTRRPSRDIVIGLEVVGVENVRRAWAARTVGLGGGPAAGGGGASTAAVACAASTTAVACAASTAAGGPPVPRSSVAARAETAKAPRITATA